jgi:hypothetical protein
MQILTVILTLNEVDLLSDYTDVALNTCIIISDSNGRLPIGLYSSEIRFHENWLSVISYEYMNLR